MQGPEEAPSPWSRMSRKCQSSSSPPRWMTSESLKRHSASLQAAVGAAPSVSALRRCQCARTVVASEDGFFCEESHVRLVPVATPRCRFGAIYARIGFSGLAESIPASIVHTWSRGKTIVASRLLAVIPDISRRWPWAMLEASPRTGTSSLQTIVLSHREEHGWRI